MSAPESTLLDSWHHNAQAWIDAIRSGTIAVFPAVIVTRELGTPVGGGAAKWTMSS